MARVRKDKENNNQQNTGVPELDDDSINGKISPLARLRKDKENNHNLQSVEDERSTSTEEDERTADATPYNCYYPLIESAIDMNLCHGW